MSVRDCGEDDREYKSEGAFEQQETKRIEKDKQMLAQFVLLRGGGERERGERLPQ